MPHCLDTRLTDGIYKLTVLNGKKVSNMLDIGLYILFTDV
jgi:hypothetical protein